MSVSSRMKQIDDLDYFLKTKQDVISDVMKKLGWQDFSVTEPKVCCPVNSGHWISESSLSKHKEICQCIKEGYLKEDLEKEPPDSSFFYEKSTDVVHVLIDSSMQESVLSKNCLLRSDQTGFLEFPQTMDRWSVQLSPEQRLAVYDHVVEVAKAERKTKKVNLEDLMVDFEKKDGQDDKPKSKLEILAEMRDYKRRRQSYRAKNVHITKKSYTEIMREVIENQTSYLSDTIKAENSEKSRRKYEDFSPSRQNNDDYDNYSSSSNYDEKYSDYKNSSRKHSKHRSKRDSYDEYSPNRRKHKKHRSRSRSPSRHKHKKSHKHKRSHD